MSGLPFVDAHTLGSLVTWPQAIDALAVAVDSGQASSVPRMSVPTVHGELLLMPGESATSLGVKVLGIAPGNPRLGRPRIQAVYVLFDAVTLTPLALLDGAALTLLRTPALSALAARQLAVTDAAALTVFGSGPQAEAHVHAVRAVRPIRRVTIVGRDTERTAALAGRLRTPELTVSIGGPASVEGADVVVCATTARAPLFDGDRLAEHACVIAVGSHEPDVRELDDRLLGRAARVVVEDRPTALREAGDVIMAVAAGALSADDLIDLAELFRRPPVTGITVFKSVGMGWQDLAVAEAAYAAWRADHIEAS